VHLLVSELYRQRALSKRTKCTFKNSNDCDLNDYNVIVYKSFMWFLVAF